VLRHLKGARGLTNDIQVVQKLPISEGKPAIEEAFGQGSTPNLKSLSVGAKNSCATITGDVHSHGELVEAVDLVSRLGASLGFVTLEPGLAPKRLTQKTKIALKRQPACGGRTLEVERIAWAAAGVQQVNNGVTITPWGFGPAEEWGY
jgi:hypothetical protein